ncbi:MAG: hypothetical protein M3Q08_17980 [Pseudomonadota bacterium]|nr:hypothetical protein [Pseudomonadota bacterium]
MAARRADLTEIDRDRPPEASASTPRDKSPVIETEDWEMLRLPAELKARMPGEEAPLVDTDPVPLMTTFRPRALMPGLSWPEVLILPLFVIVAVPTGASVSTPSASRP